MPNRSAAQDSHLSSPFAAFADASPQASSRLSTPPEQERFSLDIARRRAGAAARELSRDPRVRLVFLFGSAADPDSRTVGDIDLAVLIRPAPAFREWLRLGVDLEARVGHGLDLVSLAEASIVLAWEVVKYGECLYAADSEEELEFVTRAKSRYWDFKPFLDKQWEIAGLRLEERLRRGGQA